jgi:hypothetical protein
MRVSHGNVSYRKLTFVAQTNSELNCPSSARGLDGKAELGNFTTEALRAQSKEFLIRNYSELCELRVSAVKSPFLFWLRVGRGLTLW